MNDYENNENSPKIGIVILLKIRPIRFHVIHYGLYRKQWINKQQEKSITCQTLLIKDLMDLSYLWSEKKCMKSKILLDTISKYNLISHPWFSTLVYKLPSFSVRRLVYLYSCPNKHFKIYLLILSFNQLMCNSPFNVNWFSLRLKSLHNICEISCIP